MISVFVNNGKAHVWEPNDACTLREDHRVVGTLVGCLPRLPRQNVQLGLPLQLMVEEVTLLREKGVICLQDDSKPAEKPSEDEAQEFRERRNLLYEQQVQLCQEQSRQVRERKLPEIIEGQRKKRQKLLEKREAAGEVIDPAEYDKEVDIDVEQLTTPRLQEKHSCVQIHTACARTKHYTEATWNFPNTPEEKLRYYVFRDLWEKGHWLTSGGKFGGDFLVYPGEPGRFHSFYIAICVPYHKPISVQDLMTFSRLGANVKKTIVLCSLDDDEKLKYTSIQWTGIK